MICNACNQENQEMAKFCVFCGAKLETEVPHPLVEEAPLPVEEQTPVEAEALPPEETAVPQVEAEPEILPTEPEIPSAEPEAPPEPPAEPVWEKPAIRLPTGRSLIAMIFLSFLTFGIYPLVVWCKISGDINILASRYDGKRTPHYLTALLLALPTCFIFPLIWMHGLCRRIGKELHRRQIRYKFSAGTMWLWMILYVFCALLLAGLAAVILYLLSEVAVWIYILVAVVLVAVLLVGPFIFIHKIMKAMNLLNADFNRKG